VRAFTSADGLNYGRAAYQGQLGLARLGIAYTALEYRLGKEFAALNANGTARIASVYGSYPLLRSRSHSAYVQLSYDAKTFQDKADATGSVTDKDGKFWMLNLNGDVRDSWGGGGASTHSLTYTAGQIGIGSEVALLIDQATAATNGRFSKVALSAARLQNLTAGTGAVRHGERPVGVENLDVSEKMGLGGVGGVRAYPGGEAFGDQGRGQPGTAMPCLAGSVERPVADGRFCRQRHRHAEPCPWNPAQTARRSAAPAGLNWSGANGLLLAGVLRPQAGQREGHLRCRMRQAACGCRASNTSRPAPPDRLGQRLITLRNTS
jgi:hypothetical protein